MSIFGLDNNLYKSCLLCLGNVGALGLETELVGDVGDAVHDAVVTGIGELAPHFQSFVLGARVLELTLLTLGDTVRSLEPVKVN